MVTSRKGSYIRIRKVLGDSEALHVTFANGDGVRIATSTLRPADVKEIKWAKATVDFQGLHVVVPAEPRDLTLSWDLIRRLTDRSFAEEMNERAAQQARLVGGRLRELRQKKGLTQSAVAAMTGIEQANISRIENGRFDISASTLWKILDALGYTAADLATKEDRRHEDQKVAFG